ncbi:MAG: branched-chain amino acid ABC transporter permease [Chloroflexi bacterium]|nr:branched-chain amino acid ABC transporter permease [Chloroflexota bacterium]
MILQTTLQSLVDGAMMGAIYALITLGLALVFGVMNVVNFAHGDFVMVSMYAAFWVATLLAWDAVATPLITFPLLFLIGVLVYHLVIRRTLRHSYVVQIAVTVGLQYLLRALAQVLFQAQPKALQSSIIQGSFLIGEITILNSRLVAAAISLVVILGVSLFLSKTWAGRAIRAASDDLDVSSLVGVNYQRTYAIAFGLGTALTAIAGGLLMTFQQVSPVMGVSFGLLSYVVLAFAGLGSTIGLLISGIIIGSAEALTMAFWDPRARLLVVYLIFIIVLWLRPRGLFGRK